MARWTVEMIPAAERELKQLPDDLQGKFLHVAGLLEEFGPGRVGLPHVRPLGGKLWEMRLGGRDNIARAVYFAANRPPAGRGAGSSRSRRRRCRARSALAARRMKEQDDG